MLRLLIIYLLLLFILALTLMLGTLFNHIGSVTAISLSVFIAGASLYSNQQKRLYFILLGLFSGVVVNRWVFIGK